MTKASDLFVQALEAEGVTHVFGIPGEENLDLLESLRASDIALVLTRHEQAAGFMAATYGRLTGNAGVCLSTLGPGATNLVTPLADAQMDSVPIVAITGQVASDEQVTRLMAALRWAKEQGADDVIYVEPDTGRVLEGATSSVLMVKKGGRLRTPAPGPGVLAGTTQAAIFEHAERLGWKCKAKDIYVGELFKAESVWLVSSTRIATRVKRLDGTKLAAPDSEAEIRQLIADAVA